MTEQSKQASPSYQTTGLRFGLAVLVAAFTGSLLQAVPRTFLEWNKYSQSIPDQLFGGLVVWLIYGFFWLIFLTGLACPLWLIFHMKGYRSLLWAIGLGLIIQVFLFLALPFTGFFGFLLMTIHFGNIAATLIWGIVVSCVAWRIAYRLS